MLVPVISVWSRSEQSCLRWLQYSYCLDLSDIVLSLSLLCSISKDHGDQPLYQKWILVLRNAIWTLKLYVLEVSSVSGLPRAISQENLLFIIAIAGFYLI